MGGGWEEVTQPPPMGGWGVGGSGGWCTLTIVPLRCLHFELPAVLWCTQTSFARGLVRSW